MTENAFFYCIWFLWVCPYRLILKAGPCPLVLPICNARELKSWIWRKALGSCPPEKLGRLSISGTHAVIPGYWQKPEETSHAIKEGWLYTGDVGKMDEAGGFRWWIVKKSLYRSLRGIRSGLGTWKMSSTSTRRFGKRPLSGCPIPIEERPLRPLWP